MGSGPGLIGEALFAKAGYRPDHELVALFLVDGYGCHRRTEHIDSCFADLTKGGMFATDETRSIYQCLKQVFATGHFGVQCLYLLILKGQLFRLLRQLFVLLG
jgi:hypothetical protein